MGAKKKSSLEIKDIAVSTGKGRLSKSSHTTYSGMSSIGSLEASKTIVVNSPLYMMDQDRYNQSISAHLVCLLGPDELVGKYWSIGGKKNIVIGRNRKCDIPIQDLSISKQHLNIRLEGLKVFAEDRDSTNGTTVNDESIKGEDEVELKDNSKIKIGNIVLKFLDRGNPEIISMKQNFEKAFRDPLTGIGNTFMLDRRAKEFFIQSKQYNIPMSLVIFDIDHFKKVNDTYGHLAGDFIIKEVVRITQSCFRSNDLFIRCGGEEFCIIMQSLIDRAESAIESARRTLEGTEFKYKKHIIKVTISAGVDCYKTTDKKWKEIYERADQLLYTSKRSGRNRVSIPII